MQATDLELEGLKLIHPRIFRDQRGFFLETYSKQPYSAIGIDFEFVQDNHSRSSHGTLRGLHYQSSPGQAKLVRVVAGRIWDVAVDIRPNSKTFGKWAAAYLDAEEHAQLFVPVGFAHGFCVVSESADVVYKVSAPYNPATECGIRFDDPEIGVAWPITEPLVSDRDKTTESFADYRRRVSA